jgi:hypothetical protein
MPDSSGHSAEDGCAGETETQFRWRLDSRFVFNVPAPEKRNSVSVRGPEPP